MLSVEGASRRLALALKDDYSPLPAEEDIPQEDFGPPADELIQAIAEAKEQAELKSDHPQTTIKVYKKNELEILWSEKRQAPLSLTYPDIVDFEDSTYRGRTTVSFELNQISAQTQVAGSDEVIPLDVDESDVKGLANIVRDAGPFVLYDPFALPEDTESAEIAA